MHWPHSDNSLFAKYDALPLNAHLQHALQHCDWAPLYLDAARAIDSSLEPHSPQRDYLAVPAMFLCRHAVELTLKDLLDSALRYHDDSRTVPRTHNLQHLWEIAKPLLECLRPSSDDRTIEHAEILLLQLHAVDPSSTSLRYQDRNDRALPTEPFALDFFIDNVESLMSFMGGCANCFGNGMAEP
jgi:HEPN domain-containing protein